MKTGLLVAVGLLFACAFTCDATGLRSDSIDSRCRVDHAWDESQSRCVPSEIYCSKLGGGLTWDAESKRCVSESPSKSCKRQDGVWNKRAMKCERNIQASTSATKSSDQKSTAENHRSSFTKRSKYSLAAKCEKRGKNFLWNQKKMRCLKLTMTNLCKKRGGKWNRRSLKCTVTERSTKRKKQKIFSQTQVLTAQKVMTYLCKRRGGVWNRRALKCEQRSGSAKSSTAASKAASASMTSSSTASSRAARTVAGMCKRRGGVWNRRALKCESFQKSRIPSFGQSQRSMGPMKRVSQGKKEVVSDNIGRYEDGGDGYDKDDGDEEDDDDDDRSAYDQSSDSNPRSRAVPAASTRKVDGSFWDILVGENANGLKLSAQGNPFSQLVELARSILQKYPEIPLTKTNLRRLFIAIFRKYPRLADQATAAYPAS